jgi:hypothetical protein
MIGSNKRKVKLGFIGLGGRGRSLLQTMLMLDDVEIAGISDLHDDRLQMGKRCLEEAGRSGVDTYKDYRQLLAREDIEGILVTTSWVDHVKVAIEVMKAGKYAGCEVGAVATLEECWELVRTSEQTGMPCMLLENCCYGRDELAVLNMVKQGLFGELIHCQCGYGHDLRSHLCNGFGKGHFRIHHYMNRNGENYPTHGLGPVAKCLNINRGNQFMSLVSMSSKARGIREWAAGHLGQDHPLSRAEINQGDIVTTLIKCAHGETIVLTLDTTLPRPYSRAGRVQGTKGLWMEDNNSIHLEGRSPEHAWESFDTYRERFEHPLWKRFIQSGVRGGHGGMDYLCLRAFADSVARKIAPPIDVYDAAAWMAVSILSEQSIALGGHPVPFPDFTGGQWMNRVPTPSSPYSLDKVDSALFD